MQVNIDIKEILELFRVKNNIDIIEFVKRIDTEIVQDFDFTIDLVLSIIETMKSDFSNNEDKNDFIKKIEMLIK